MLDVYSTCPIYSTTFNHQRQSKDNARNRDPSIWLGYLQTTHLPVLALQMHPHLCSTPTYVVV